MAAGISEMHVTVLFFGALKDIVGRADECVAISDDADINALYESYAVRFPGLAVHSATLLFARNREFVTRTAVLQEGDEVAFLPPVSGGTETADPSDAQRSLIRLTRDPISSASLAKQLQRPRDGALVAFDGIVRDHSGDRKTLFLEYEGYEPMALAKMREIADDARAKFRIDSIAIVHRLGRLEIGEASVVIVVAAEHRGAAFEACRYAIDALKRVVPIWKKEYFEGGEVWVEGEASGHSVAAAARQV
jgi:MoaE-MoaD fusion protein